MSKKRFFIELAFNGTQYHGWQLQKNAHTVQAELNLALKTILREEIETIGAGRTDTGVHAKEFFVHLDLANPLPTKIVHSLNSILPHDVVIKKIFPVKPEAHARFDANFRTYSYYLYQEKNPFLRGRACFYPQSLDIRAMNDAAKILFDYDDFSSFSKNKTDTKTNICSIMKAQWKKMDDQIVFTIRADRFLRGMVRSIVGTITEVGRGRTSLDEFRKIIEGKKRSDAGESVDPCGLYLMEVGYDMKKIKTSIK